MCICLLLVETLCFLVMCCCFVFDVLTCDGCFCCSAESMVRRTEAGAEEFGDCGNHCRLWGDDNAVWTAARCNDRCICEHHQWRRESVTAAAVCSNFGLWYSTICFLCCFQYFVKSSRILYAFCLFWETVHLRWSKNLFHWPRCIVTSCFLCALEAHSLTYLLPVLSGIFVPSLRAKVQQWTILTAKILKVCHLLCFSFSGSFYYNIYILHCSVVGCWVEKPRCWS